jgi:hypothetical protein
MPGGRPKKPLKYDYELIKDLASIFCTQDEIANIMGVSVRKLQYDPEFMRLYKEGIDGARSHIRRAQLKLALGGNATMLVWLGKQYLGQREPIMDMSVPADEITEDMEQYEE